METKLRTTHRKKALDLHIFSCLQRQSMEWEYSQLVFVCQVNFTIFKKTCQGVFKSCFCFVRCTRNENNAYE